MSSSFGVEPVHHLVCNQTSSACWGCLTNHELECPDFHGGNLTSIVGQKASQELAALPIAILLSQQHHFPAHGGANEFTHAAVSIMFKQHAVPSFTLNALYLLNMQDDAESRLGT